MPGEIPISVVQLPEETTEDRQGANVAFQLSTAFG